jgi:hypothetical protein
VEDADVVEDGQEAGHHHQEAELTELVRTQVVDGDDRADDPDGYDGCGRSDVNAGRARDLTRDRGHDDGAVGGPAG